MPEVGPASNPARGSKFEESLASSLITRTAGLSLETIGLYLMGRSTVPVEKANERTAGSNKALMILWIQLWINKTSKSYQHRRRILSTGVDQSRIIV